MCLSELSIDKYVRINIYNVNLKIRDIVNWGP